MVLSVFVATVLIANICGVSTSGALVGASLATIIYILTTGMKSPMFLSNSGAFVAPVIFALSFYGYLGVAVGGLTSCLIYCLFGVIFSKIPYEKIYKVFPPALIGAVTVVIGINLMPFILTYVQINGITNMYGVFIALITTLVIALVSHYAKGIFKILPFLIGILAGYLVAVILTLTNIYPIIDFSLFKNVGLLRIPDFASNHWEYTVGTFLPIIIMYIAYTISAIMECLSDHAALSGIIGVDLYKEPGLSKIFIGEGLAESLFGGMEFPDGTFAIDEIEEIIQCQKVFMETVSEIREENMFTFPVLTFSLLYQDGHFEDEEFAKWASKHNMKWSDSNFFVSDNVGVLSNCCRLLSDTKKLVIIIRRKINCQI